MPPTPTIPPPPGGGTGGKGGKKGRKKPLTPQQSAAQSQARSRAKYQQSQQRGIPSSPSDPYVTINKHGRLVPVADSKHAMRVHGRPVTMAEAQSAKNQLDQLWLAYLGRPISAREFQKFVNNGWSQYQIIDKYLSHRPNFSKSPVYKQQAGDYVAAYHQVYGENATPPPELVRYAIVNHLSQAAFQDALRKRPDYTNSVEFKDGNAKLSTVYTTIFGLPDSKGDAIIRQATLGGWSPDQFAKWLRQQPEYTQSEEFRTKALSIASQLTGITGGLPTLSPGPPLASPFGAASGAPAGAPAGGPNPVAPGLDVTPPTPISPFGEQGGGTA